ncbi:hypothetical protein C7S15_7779 [Burkholderia cepacia]|nr:hypothetical protein [Burkholderia cepacia]
MVHSAASVIRFATLPAHRDKLRPEIRPATAATSKNIRDLVRQ